MSINYWKRFVFHGILICYLFIREVQIKRCFCPHVLVHTSAHLFFFTVMKRVTSFHSFIHRQLSVDKYKILQPVRTDFALWPGVWNNFEFAVKLEIWHLEVWSFFVLQSLLRNVDKIVHFVHYCIFHSVLFKTYLWYVSMCIEGYCNNGTSSFKTVTVSSSSTAHGSQDSNLA